MPRGRGCLDRTPTRFAGFPSERTNGIVLFTGERITSASARHILGEEASRALRQLGVRDRIVTSALDRADEGLKRCLAQWTNDRGRGNPGTFCCGKCTVGLWRNLTAGGLDRQAERLSCGLEHLRQSRDGKGGWRRYPFWYTVLALAEMDFSAASNELSYSERLLRPATTRSARSGVYAMRRRQLASRVLDRTVRSRVRCQKLTTVKTRGPSAASAPSPSYQPYTA